MRVLIYAHAFAPSIGGAETYALLLAQGLSRRLAAGEDAADAGGTVVVVTQTPGAGVEDGALPFRVVRRPGLLALWRLVGWADVVQLAGPALVPLLFGLLRRRPLVVEHHGYQAICPNGLLLHEPTVTACPGHFMASRYGECLRCRSASVGWWRGLASVLLTVVRRWLVRRVAVNVPITTHVLARLALPRSEVIYHGVPDSSSARSPAGLGAPGTRPAEPAVFAYLGRLVREKGLDLLLQAARHLADRGYAFSVAFIGDGPERPRLEALTRKLGLCDRVTFVGWLRGDALEAAMARVAALVMPSILEETAGLAAMEQMMRGRLVIAADIGGLGEVVEGAGLKFPAGDARALADCMRRVLEEPRLVAELGARARARALERFREETMTDAHLRLYRRLLGP